MKNHTKFTALITTTLLTVALAGPANATGPVESEPTVETASMPVLAPIEASPTASVAFEKPTVTTAPRRVVPVAVESPVLAAASAPVAAKAAVATQAAPAKAAPAKATPTTPAPVAPAPVAVSASGKGATIAAAAYAQIGVKQDCTRLASNALAAAGINFHGWPAGYLSLGARVSAAEAQPGDLAYYANGGSGLAHIAVYVGGGKAIHGGWNGNTTSLQSVNVGSGPVFIRVA